MTHARMLAPLLLSATALSGCAIFDKGKINTAAGAHAAAESADLLDRALESMGDALLVCNARDEVVRWNAQYEDLFPWLKPVLRPGLPFRDMARVFARTYPPRTPVMAHYGESFADFIQNYDPAASVPYLPDVARLEWAYVCAFHAADVAPVPTQSLLELIADAERLAANRCQLHPSLRVVSSDYAVASLWAAHQGDLDIGRVDPWKAESALVLRNGLTVEIREVSPGGATFFNRLIQGEPLAQAVQAADAPGSGFALEDCLGLLIQSSAIVAIETSEATLT